MRLKQIFKNKKKMNAKLPLQNHENNNLNNGINTHTHTHTYIYIHTLEQSENSPTKINYSRLTW